MPDATDAPEPDSSAHRWITGAFGALFVGLGAAIVVLAADGNRLGAYLAALVIGGLGVDAIISAVRRRRSLLSRIGPLP